MVISNYICSLIACCYFRNTIYISIMTYILQLAGNFIDFITITTTPNIHLTCPLVYICLKGKYKLHLRFILMSKRNVDVHTFNLSLQTLSASKHHSQTTHSHRSWQLFQLWLTNPVTLRLIKQSDIYIHERSQCHNYRSLIETSFFACLSDTTEPFNHSSCIVTHERHTTIDLSCLAISIHIL